MKCIWEAKDIRCGMRVGRRNAADTFTIYRSYTVGYSYSQTTEGKTLHLVALTDGSIVANFNSDEELASHLTSEQYEPLSLPHFIHILKDVAVTDLQRA